MSASNILVSAMPLGLSHLMEDLPAIDAPILVKLEIHVSRQRILIIDAPTFLIRVVNTSANVLVQTLDGRLLMVTNRANAVLTRALLEIRVE